jgi:putative cardiolipin synthase
VNADALGRLRGRLEKRIAETSSGRYAEALRGDDSVRRMLAGDWPMTWSPTYAFIADEPAKVTMAKREIRRTNVAVALAPLVESARSGVTIISPYFVPGDAGTAGLTRAAGDGKSVRILTNSLVANDVAAVHGGYSRHRKSLLQGGVELWELKPTAGGTQASSLFGSSGASLHTKAFAVDGRALFVGSYNLDPRSTWLNCEQGVLVESESLTRQLEALFESHTTGQHAWRVTLADGDLLWSDGVERFHRDPRASAWRRFQAWTTKMLHLDAQL